MVTRFIGIPWKKKRGIRENLHLAPGADESGFQNLCQTTAPVATEIEEVAREVLDVIGR